MKKEVDTQTTSSVNPYSTSAGHTLTLEHWHNATGFGREKKNKHKGFILLINNIKRDE